MPLSKPVKKQQLLLPSPKDFRLLPKDKQEDILSRLSLDNLIIFLEYIIASLHTPTKSDCCTLEQIVEEEVRLDSSFSGDSLISDWIAKISSRTAEIEKSLLNPNSVCSAGPVNTSCLPLNLNSIFEMNDLTWQYDGAATPKKDSLLASTPVKNKVPMDPFAQSNQTQSMSRTFGSALGEMNAELNTASWELTTGGDSSITMPLSKSVKKQQLLLPSPKDFRLLPKDKQESILKRLNTDNLLLYMEYITGGQQYSSKSDYFTLEQVVEDNVPPDVSSDDNYISDWFVKYNDHSVAQERSVPKFNTPVKDCLKINNMTANPNSNPFENEKELFAAFKLPNPSVFNSLTKERRDQILNSLPIIVKNKFEYYCWSCKLQTMSGL